MKKYLTGMALMLMIAIAGCDGGEDIKRPRPLAFHRLSFPQHEYQPFTADVCPFTFEFPKYGELQLEREDSCIRDIYFPPFDAKWHLTYRNIPESGQSRSAHYEDYRKLVYKHVKKAEMINETPVKTANGWGTVFELYGNVGTPAQVFFGDSTHLVMTSFYYPTAVKNDSLAPVTEFLLQDLYHMIETMEWKQN